MANKLLVSESRKYIWRPLVKWGKRTLIAFFSLVLFLLLLGTIYQTSATWLDNHKLSAPGKLYDVGGYRIHAKVTGHGPVTVVMDAGLMNTHLTWVTVEERIAKFAQVVTYDRAGYGWSESGPKPRSSEQIAKELHKLLSAAQVKPPYVLVGHSMGGINVRTFARKYPNEVAGMVLLDSSHEDQINRIPDEASKMQNINILAVMAPIGLARLVLPTLMFDNENDPPEVVSLRPTVAAKSLSTKHIFAMRDEYSAFVQRLGALQLTPPSFGDKPLIVISHDTESPHAVITSEEEHAEQVAWNKIWRNLQTELAATSSNAKIIVAKNSGHMVHIDSPELVVESIHKVIDQVRLMHSTNVPGENNLIKIGNRKIGANGKSKLSHYD